MLIRPVTYETTTYHKTPVFRAFGINGEHFDKLPIRVLTEEELVDALFLCKCGDNVFVSDIRFDSNFGYYVDDVRGREAIKITDLTEIYLIENND
jgi:hypothetical protein